MASLDPIASSPLRSFPLWKLLLPLGALLLSGMIIAVVLGTRTDPFQPDLVLLQRHIAHREALLGRPLSPPERASIERQLVEEELLVQQAARMGFHLSDPDIRKHMARLALTTFPFVPSEPTEADLAALLAEKPDRYQTEPRVTFEHFYFEKDEAAAVSLSQRLAAGHPAPPSAGDHFWLGARMEGYSTAQLLTLFGHTFVQAMRKAPVGVWQGPINSGRGWHVVRLEERHAPERFASVDLKQRLVSDWTTLQRQAAMAEWFNELRTQNGLDPVPVDGATSANFMADGQSTPTGW